MPTPTRVVELRHVIDPPWLACDAVTVGTLPSGIGTPIAYVTVACDDEPVFRVDVDERDPECHAFEEAIAWGDFVVIGIGARVHFVSVASRASASIALSGYFGHLYPLDDRLLVADAEHLVCFDRAGAFLWRSPPLGLDGVIVHDVTDGIIRGSGEWDPPGGWEPFAVSLASGEVVP